MNECIHQPRYTYPMGFGDFYFLLLRRMLLLRPFRSSPSGSLLEFSCYPPPQAFITSELRGVHLRSPPAEAVNTRSREISFFLHIFN
jgi:hypothetical protein